MMVLYNRHGRTYFCMLVVKCTTVQCIASSYHNTAHIYPMSISPTGAEIHSHTPHFMPSFMRIQSNPIQPNLKQTTKLNDIQTYEKRKS